MRPTSKMPSPDEEFGRTPVFPPHQTRRKVAGTRTLLVVSGSGQSFIEEVGKHSIMQRTGLPARDLRILDPMLSYPSTILGRERAIVINLEHIKAIITAAEVLVLNSKDPIVAPFIQDLQSRILNSHDAAERTIENSDTEMDERAKEGNPWATMDVPAGRSPKVLPFEFRALEVCLESTCRCLELETSTLEQEAYPALDELTSKISTLNLERVRQIKARLVGISGRVQKVRDELEHLLDDDMDMAEMFLTNKLAYQPSDGTSSRDELDNDAFESDNERDEDLKTKSKSFSESLRSFKPDIEELEMLLEAYFAQIDGILQKLSTLREYVEDTEDYINIMLDDKQNQLLQMGVILSTATLILNAGIVVVGIFGMNIHINLFDATQLQFLETSFGTLIGCLVIYFIAIGLGKQRGLLA